MNLILLDIDGVLVSGKSWEKLQLRDDLFPDFIPEAVINLNKIISKTQASIILVTSHRHSFTIEEWYRIFNTRGVKVNSLDKLPKLDQGYASRADEILAWYKQEGRSNNFVVIDDDTTLHALPSKLKHRCVITKSHVGLRESDTTRAIMILLEKKISKRKRESILSNRRRLAAKTLFRSFKILNDYGAQPRYAIIETLKASMDFNEWELHKYRRSEHTRWQTVLDFYTSECVKTGYLKKEKGLWKLTRKGEKLLNLGPNGMIAKIAGEYGKQKHIQE